MKRFVFEITIDEGDDEFWEDLEHTTDLGIAAVTELVTDAIEERFNYNFNVKMTKFEYEQPSSK